MTDAVEAYRWIAEGTLEMAGCVTVVAAADPARVAASFGCDEPAAAPSSYAEMNGIPDQQFFGLQLWLGHADDAVVVIEDNGYEGSRAEVLRAASKASASGVAASVFWNVNGLVIFSAARKGKLACSVELLDCEPDEVPRSVRQLAKLGARDDIDSVALGAAMVARFTGVSFDEQMILGATHRTFTPVPADLGTYGPRGSALKDYAPEVLEAIVNAAPSTQRSLANWAARAAAAEAGVEGEPLVRALTEQLDRDSQPSLPPGFDGRLAAWQREQQQWENQHDDYDDWGGNVGALEGRFLQGKIWAGRALKAATHPDPLEAALQVTFNSMWTFYCTRTERPGRFVEDENGRRAVYDELGRLPERTQAVADLALEALSTDTPEWSGLASRLPRPLTPQERQVVIERDQDLQARGAFRTYDTVSVDRRTDRYDATE
jgi:hypothetical protein